MTESEVRANSAWHTRLCVVQETAGDVLDARMSSTASRLATAMFFGIDSRFMGGGLVRVEAGFLPGTMAAARFALVEGRNQSIHDVIFLFRTDFNADTENMANDVLSR